MSVVRLDRHPDRGCWISDDRVNAFVSAEAPGVAEIGFHGLQPVSRNSRLLVRPEGVLHVSVRRREETAFPCAEVEWEPAAVRTTVRNGDAAYSLGVFADGRRIVLRVATDDRGEADVIVRFSHLSMFTAVQGERAWREPVTNGHTLHLSCRDRIMLAGWVRRNGPYAGDFLIPEHVRRRIFSRRCRSGLATYDDLLPEYRNADIPLYDAETFVRLGGEGFSAVRDDSAFTFTARLSPANRYACEFIVAFGERPEQLGAPQAPPLPPLPAEVPHLTLTGFESTAGFFASVPGVVRSATLRDSGMTRASTGAYYWIWAWDSMVTALEMPLWGNPGGAAQVARFVNAHRDEGGAIPARWTRALEALDTPPRGALDFLLLLLAVRCAHEGTDCLAEVYPHAAAHLDAAARTADRRGLAPNIGFYPDLPVAFGRTEQSAVAMETGALYAFCRLMEALARARGDEPRARTALELAGRIQSSFAATYFDTAAGFFIDAVDVEGGRRNDARPLFTLLFLQTPLGVPLLRPHTAEAAAFARRYLQSPFGTRLLPAGDRRSQSEDALSSWYPHWDVYLLTLFRRGKERSGIITWLSAVERLLGRLGYVPEFMRMEGLSGDDPEVWRRHGAATNLNCATGWFRAILEGLFGLEFDTGGMAVVPLDLDIPPLTLNGLRYRGSAWTIRVERKGGGTPELSVDGERLTGCTKIPRRFYDGGSHRLDISYTDAAKAPLFTEIVNAEVIEAEGSADRACVRVNGFGTVDVAFAAEGDCAFRVDGTAAAFSVEPGTGTRYAQLALSGTHTIALIMAEKES